MAVSEQMEHRACSRGRRMWHFRVAGYHVSTARRLKGTVVRMDITHSWPRELAAVSMVLDKWWEADSLR